MNEAAARRRLAEAQAWREAATREAERKDPKGKGRVESEQTKGESE